MQGPNLFLVTEWVKRGSLNNVLIDPMVLWNDSLVRKLAKQIAVGIHYLHQKVTTTTHVAHFLHVIVKSTLNVK